MDGDTDFHLLVKVKTWRRWQATHCHNDTVWNMAQVAGHTLPLRYCVEHGVGGRPHTATTILCGTWRRWQVIHCHHDTVWNMAQPPRYCVEHGAGGRLHTATTKLCGTWRRWQVTHCHHDTVWNSAHLHERNLGE